MPVVDDGRGREVAIHNAVHSGEQRVLRLPGVSAQNDLQLLACQSALQLLALEQLSLQSVGERRKPAASQQPPNHRKPSF